MLKFKSSEDCQIWFSSDLHINHKNICSATSDWIDKYSTRDFNSINEMNDLILNNINTLVKPNDILILLGDLLFRFKRPEDYEKLLNRINCNNLYILWGNHDRRDSLLELDNIKIEYLGDIIFLQIDDRKVFCSHYSHRVWPESHHGSYHLYGHSHGSLPGVGKSMDIGIDAAFKEFGIYRPYKWKEIKEKLDKIDIKNLDYHNRETT